MNKLYLFLLIILFSSISFPQNSRTSKQPEKVFIQGSSPTVSYVGAKEVVLIYLEDALGDKNGDLLLQVKYRNINELLGKVSNPITNENWYFYAEWNLSTKGGGYLILKIDYTKYNTMERRFYNTLD